MASRIIIADDHPLLRNAVRQAVEKLWPECEVIEVSSLMAATQEAAAGKVELMILDLHMEDSHGLSGLLDLRQDYPAMPVIVMSASEEPRVWQAVKRLGASGFIPKSSPLDTMRIAFSAVKEGDMWFPPNTGDEQADEDDLDRLASLTPAQRRILHLVNQGLLNKQIAFEIDISEATVKAHISAIFRRLRVVNRTQAVLIAQKLEVGLAVTNL